mmetsp:Transcript_27749/g.58677  ORF Transcript_27749/g.58677 Transcript_27749/m.58677 type:complete len:260 (-) Transcript_27749:625-1404(-)
MLDGGRVDSSSPFPKSVKAPAEEPMPSLFLVMAGELLDRVIEPPPSARFFSLAFAAVTRLHMLSISRAANLFRISSCNTLLHSRSLSSVALSCCNFAVRLGSRGSSLFSVRARERSAVTVAASTSSACASRFFFSSASSVQRLARQSSVRMLRILDSRLIFSISVQDFPLKALERSRAARVSVMSIFGSIFFSPPAASPSAGGGAAGSGAGGGATSPSAAGGASIMVPSVFSSETLRSGLSELMSCAISKRLSPVSRDK